jgi:hypothetical protein
MDWRYKVKDLVNDINSSPQVYWSYDEQYQNPPYKTATEFA